MRSLVVWQQPIRDHALTLHTTDRCCPAIAERPEVTWPASLMTS